MGYLITALRDEAANAVQGLQWTHGPYEMAISVLRDRFGSENILVQEHWKSLADIKPVHSSPQVSQLRRLHHSMQAHIRGLECLGTSTESYCSMLYSLLLRAIPGDMALKFNRVLADKPSTSVSTGLPFHLEGLQSLLTLLHNEKKHREELSTRFERSACNDSTGSQFSQIAKTDGAIREYLTSGVSEKVRDEMNENAREELVYYIPHHAVMKEESVTTETRIVFEASSHEGSATPLSDNLDPGCDLNPDTLALLVKLRLYPIALIADVQKTFLQIAIRPEDTDTLRYLSYETSPQEGKRLPKNSIYVEDVILGAASPEEAEQVYLQVHQVFHKAFRKLHKTGITLSRNALQILV
ncbi:uncharacterized protein LOC135373670 [Ornithodoros turicata]|uniref:uncharacterized protein LOC135373670 n=1 Tax=Ornithodoros turicata TaxID=34597 RepID=UPI00313997A9